MRSFARVLISGSLCALGAEAFVASPKGAMPHHREKPTTSRHMLDAVDTFYQTQPYVAAFLTCSVKASVADLVAQMKKSFPDQQHDAVNHLDVSRNLAFVVYGGFWQGMFQQFLFSHVYPMWFGTSPTLESILSQVAFDTSIMGPCIFMPICYMSKSLFAGQAAEEGLVKYWNDVMTRNLLQTYWSIWIPAQCATFGFVPHHWRIVFVAAVSFYWITKLSAISSSSSSMVEQQQQDIPDKENELSSLWMLWNRAPMGMAAAATAAAIGSTSPAL